MPNEWFIRNANEVKGPLSDQQVKQLAALGQITPATHIRLGAGAWAMASSVKGLFSSLPPRPQHPVDDQGFEDMVDSLVRDGEEGPHVRPSGADSSVGVTVMQRDEEERQVASIGQTYTAGFLSGEGISKTCLVLTTQRLSGVGKKYGKDYIQESFVADLRDVSSIGIIYRKPIVPLVLGIIFCVTIVGLPIGLICLIVAFVAKERFAAINVHGFEYAFSLRGVPLETAEQFLVKVFREMQRRKSR
jgi:hypothetical protein